MAKPFRNLIDKMPPDRVKRIKKKSESLKKEIAAADRKAKKGMNTTTDTSNDIIEEETEGRDLAARKGLDYALILTRKYFTGNRRL